MYVATFINENISKSMIENAGGIPEILIELDRHENLAQREELDEINNSTALSMTVRLTSHVTRTVFESMYPVTRNFILGTIVGTYLGAPYLGLGTAVAYTMPSEINKINYRATIFLDKRLERVSVKISRSRRNIKENENNSTRNHDEVCIIYKVIKNSEKLRENLRCSK